MSSTLSDHGKGADLCCILPITIPRALYINIDRESRHTEKAQHDEDKEAQEHKDALPLAVCETGGTLVRHSCTSAVPVLNASVSRANV